MNNTQANNQRLLSLDILRGITIAGMILVNNPGSWGSVYAPLAHARWNGLTPTDLVFPFFLFIMGISTYISLQKYDFQWSGAAAWKIVKRTLVIFAIGLGLAWLSLFFRTWNSLGREEISFLSRLGQSCWTLGNIRILGVLQRLALSYGAAALIVITVRHKRIPSLIAVLLLSYCCIMLFGNGFEYNESNILSIVDRNVLGLNHMLRDNGIDPEGVLSTIPSIAHLLIGFCCGKLLVETKDINEKIQHLFLIGTTLTFSGFLFSYGCPINKKVWSPTFVLVTCGLACSTLALLTWVIDAKGKKKWCKFFESFGANPLLLYVVAAIFSFCMSEIRFPYGEGAISAQRFVYGKLLQPLLGNYPASLVYALLFVLLVWAVGYIFYRKRIYIKI
jgi:predicted acyltransferase